MSLFTAMTTRDARTTNGMVTNSTTSDPVLDMFFQMGGSRNMDENAIQLMFTKAYRYNRVLATKAMFYNRDVRGGQMERRSFRLMFEWLCANDPGVAIANIENVPFYGRYDDLLVAYSTPVWPAVADFIYTRLQSGDSLCAKWMPRENKKNGYLARALAEHWGYTPKQYRKLLSGLTTVVERSMCANEWSRINYNHVPSKAINQYRNAYYRHDSTRFSEWIASLTKEGTTTTKINAGAIFPHDIVRKFLNFYMTPSGAEKSMLEAQWNALPNYMTSGARILPVCDVSGSMSGLPLEVCVSLGIYLSERNTGPFKDGFVTFSNRPTLQILRGTLSERVSQLAGAGWQMNTNLEAVFSLILSNARASSLTENEMPTDILILSDMQFDACVHNADNTALDMIKRLYTEAGYKVPNVIFWNLSTSTGIPLKMHQSGAALVSGFSPSIMKNLLGGEITPISIMNNVLNSERYDRVR